MYPALTLHAGREYIPVVISRSGLTSEAVRAAQILEKDHHLRTIAITCADGQPLEAACSVTWKLLDADERSTVMTRSFTSMLLGLQYFAATVSGNDAFRRALVELPQQVDPLLNDVPQRLRLFVESRSFSDFVFLAQGPVFGLASDFPIDLGLQSPEYVQPAAFTIWGQLYGVYYGLKKGLNPDSPKNLTRVVELADGH